MTTPKGRARSWRPGWERRKEWRPEWVGLKPGYPRTREAWEAQRDKSRRHARELHARGVFHRRGIPDGWSGRRDELAVLRERSAEAAQQAVTAMRSRGDLEGDDPRAAEALAFVASVVLDPTASATDRLSAARVLLAFTRPRPSARHTASVLPAEEFLADLLGRA